MEYFKKILRQVLAEQGYRLKLQSGVPVSVTAATGTRDLANEQVIDDAYLAKLFQFLFPNDRAQLQAMQVTKGALAVPNVGKLLLIAVPTAPSSLSLYVPPLGQALFDQDWAHFSQPGGQHAMPSAVPVVVATSAAPPVAVVPVAPKEPLASNASNGSGNIGATPSGMDLFGAMTSPTSAEPEPPRTAPSGIVMPAAAPPTLHQPARSVPAEPASPRAVHDDDGETPPGVINFGADAGAADISNGDNPIDPVLIDMIRQKASDLHMTAGEPYCYRIDGEITRIGDHPLSPGEMENFLLKLMPRRNQIEFAKISDTDFAYEIRGVGRFRVNVFRDMNGVGTVMRHIPSKILTAEQLNLPPAITKFCNLTKGLVVVTGPTGSGKSTTLAAMIDLINKTRHDHILTVEDPVEFVHPQQKCLVNQREVHKHTQSFSRALRAALREDPDIVLVGEMRDLETVAIAIETAETGHLVFGTLHTNTAISTVDRIIQQFPHEQQEQIRMMLSSSLKGVIAQTLLKKKSGGRIAAHEILVVNDAVSAMIREGKNHMIPNHMQSQKADGNVLLNESLAKFVRDGVIDVEDAFRKAIDKTGIIETFKRIGIKYDPPGSLAAPSLAVKKPA